MSTLFDLAALISTLILAAAALRLIVDGLQHLAQAIDTDPQAAAAALVCAIAAGVLAAWCQRRFAP